jgi:hypothetical protein
MVVVFPAPLIPVVQPVESEKMRTQALASGFSG